MIDAVIFDLDGTLVDSLAGIEYAADAAWAAIRPDRACPPLRPLIGPPIRDMFQRAWPDATTETLLALEHAFREVYDRDGWRMTTTYPGVIETLASIVTAGFLCLGVTNKPQFATQRILEHCTLKKYFREFLSPDSGEPIYASKADAVSALLVRHSLNPSATLLVGDSLDDARAAQACGLQFAAFTGGYGQVEQQIDFPIELKFARFTDLLYVIDKGGA